MLLSVQKDGGKKVWLHEISVKKSDGIGVEMYLSKNPAYITIIVFKNMIFIMFGGCDT